MHRGLPRSLLLATAVAVLAALPAQAKASGSTYYLSLGDSLAQGVQPTASGQSVVTNQGYADDLYALERLRVPGLQLEKLGCPGETTATMISGGVCKGVYASGTQLGDAVAFLHTHAVAFVTLDIGANNVDGCVVGGSISPACVQSGLQAVGHDLPIILATLRAAAPGVPIYAMNYYDPFLAVWLQGPAGQLVAEQSVGLATSFDGLLGSIYGGFGVPVADVARAFHTTDFTPLPFIGLPANVAAVCTLTWMCAAPPVGPNIHPNAAGYWVIAASFGATLRRGP